MASFDKPSRCSGGQGLNFRWYGFPTCSVGDDLETATAAFFTAIEAPDRVWSPHSRAMAKVEFQRRIQKAQRGELRPVAEVKPVDIDNPPPLYEIRWQTIPITTRSSGALSHKNTVIRLYHSEPEAHPQHFVGHHIHEKDLETEHVYSAQDEEIQVSKRYYDAGVPTSWRIAS